MEIFFLDGFVCWRHECAQWEYEARSRNWIWSDKFTSYVIINITVDSRYCEHPQGDLVSINESAKWHSAREKNIGLSLNIWNNMLLSQH